MHQSAVERVSNTAVARKPRPLKKKPPVAESMLAPSFEKPKKKYKKRTRSESNFVPNSSPSFMSARRAAQAPACINAF
jgi:hypothetical protein